MAKTKAKASADSSAARKNPSPQKTAKTGEPTDVVAKIESNRGALSRFDKKTRKDRRKLLCRSVEEGLILRRAPKATWAAFVKSKVWDNDKSRPKIDQQDEAVRFVMMVYEEGNPRRSKQASDVFRVVEHFLSCELSDEQIVQAVSECVSIRTVLDLRGHGKSTSSTKAPPKAAGSTTSDLTSKAKAASTTTVKAKKAIQPPHRRPEDYTDIYPTNLAFAPNEKRFAGLPNGTKVRVTAIIEDSGRFLNVSKLKVI